MGTLKHEQWRGGRWSAWLILTLALGIGIGLLSAEIIGLPLLLLAPFALVRVGRRKQRAVSTLLAFAAGIELVACWVGFPVLFPSSFSTPANRGQSAIWSLGIVVLGIFVAASSLLPAVRRGPGLPSS